MAITPTTIRLVQALRRGLLKITDQQVRDLVAAWANAWDEVAGELELATLDLAARAENGRITRAQVLRSGRLAAALDTIGRRLTSLADQAGVRIVADLPAVVDAAGRAQEEIIDSQLPKAERGNLTDWSRVDHRQLEAIINRSTEQIASDLWPLSSEAQGAIRRELVRGVAAGAGPRETATRMLQRTQGEFNGGLTRALTIARTETLDAHRAAAKVSHDANADVLGGWIWLTDLRVSPPPCPACLGMAGTEHPLSEPGPLGHQNCVLPGAVVSGPRALASTTRWFDGEVVDIESASGNLLSVTPNHPVLTGHGWIAAGELEEGMHVISSTGPERMARTDRPDDHQVPARIEDLAEALGRASAMPTVAMPTAAEDFHGDGAGSQVHVVRTDSRLVYDELTAIAEQRRQQQFAVGDVGLPSFTGGGGLDQFGSAANPAFRGFVGGRSIAGVLLAGSGRHHEAIGSGAVSLRHTCGRQSDIDHRSRHVVGLRQGVDGLTLAVASGDLGVGQVVEGRRISELGSLLNLGLLGGAPQPTLAQDGSETGMAYPMPTAADLAAFAGEVVADRILKIRRRTWSGHVYNLQTATGWFVANGILTHNCRCSRMPRTKTWAELGIEGMDEPESQVPDAADWFDSQDQKTQRAILRPARYDAWKRGEYPMSAWAQRVSADGWRDSYRTSRPKPSDGTSNSSSTDLLAS